LKALKHSIFTQPLVAYLPLLIFALPHVTQGQHVQKVGSGENYLEYQLTNDSLAILPDQDLMIPYSGTSRSIQILNSDISTRQIGSQRIASLKDQWNIPDEKESLYDIKNPGTHRGNQVASLVINATRIANEQDGTVLIVRNLRFRVATSSSRNISPSNAANFSSSIRTETDHPLASGRWFKFPVTKNGIYKIDAEYLESIGVDPGSVSPEEVHIWGSAGEPLPRLNSAPRPELQQIPVRIQDDGNSGFSSGDRILFYAKNPHVVEWNNNIDRYLHELHPYSEHNTIFLNIDGSVEPLTMDEPASSPSPGRTVTQFRDFIWLEEEKFKTEDDLKSGLQWFGQEFNNNNASRNNDPDDRNIWSFKITGEIFNDTIPGLDLSDPVAMRIRLVGRSTRSMEFDIFANNEFVDDAPISSIRSYVASEFSSARIGVINEITNIPDIGGNILSLQAAMKNNEISTQGWIDFIELNFTRRLVAENDVLSFFSPRNNNSQTVAYELQGFSSQPTVMEVTDPVNPKLLDVQQSGNNFRALGSAAPQKKFMAQARFFTPQPAEEVPNQNLHGISRFPDFIILTAAEFIDEAREFAQYRSSNSNLTTVVTTQEQIFNEFSAGVPDVAGLRDYIKFLYDRADGNSNPLPRYLLFFGDTSYDYKGVSTRANQENKIFTFQSRESIFRTSTYGSDDFFGLLDDNEGEWSPTTRAERVDLGIGRFPVQTAEEAAILVDKIKRYESSAALGDWRSLFTFAADDGINGNENDEDLHVFNADVTARSVTRNDAVRINKIYQFGFPVQNTSEGRRRPGATRAFIRSINEGSLVTNYMGHGDETTLSGERLFNVEDISQLTNDTRLTLLISATCSFGRFDDVVLQSGAERMMLWPEGGSIGAFTTSRVVFTSSNATGGNNFGLNIALTREMVTRDEEGLPRRLGDIYRLTKNTFAGSVFNSRKFILLGDPSMRFGLPSFNTKITSVNNKPVSDSLGVVQARALDRVTVSGQIEDGNENVLNSFNGVANLQVFDAQRFVSLPDLEWVPELCDLEDCGYLVENDQLFRGRASITAGKFEAEFIVPRDISFSDSTGRILTYATGNERDASGSFDRIRFNGINEQAANDKTGPEMDVFLNDETFVNGNLVEDSPQLIVEISDESGINTTGLGVGHELLASINTEPPQKFTLNEFYESDLDQFNSGRIEFPLNDLPEGVFELEVQAWDVHNNPSQKSITFEVAESDELKVTNIFNYPNPMSSRTEFIFEHNQAGNALDISIRIYTLSGRPVKRIQQNNFIASGNMVRIPWEGRDQNNEPIANGTYIYVVDIRADTPSGRQRKEKIEKLVIIK